MHYCDHGMSTPKCAYYGRNYLLGHLSLAGKTPPLVRVILVQLGPLPGADAGGGGPGGQDPPFGGPPNFIKRGKKSCAHARKNAAF